MKVDRIELYHVAIPLPKPFYPSWIPGYPQTVNRFTLLRLTTDDGVQGLAAGVAFEEECEGLFEITPRGIAIKTVRDKGLFAALSLARKRRR